MSPDDTEQEPPAELAARVAAGLERLPTHVRAWATRHVCTPRLVEVERIIPSGGGRSELVQRWLVFEPLPDESATTCVFFDPITRAFELGSDATIGALHGFKGSFDDAVRSAVDSDSGLCEFVHGVLVYVVTAYRWDGRTPDTHRYVVYVGIDRTLAMRLADREGDDRGGKYGIEVVEYSGLVGEHGPIGTVVHRVPSM